MKNGPVVLAVVIGGLVVVFGMYLFYPGLHNASLATEKQSVFDHVMQTKALRCGYVVVAPLLIKDSKTGELSGPIYDIVMSIGKTLNLKIDWAEETTYATAVEGLRTNRFDMVCAHIFLRPNLMANVEFTQPYYYIPIRVVQRKGETRFKTIAAIDRPDIKIAAIDGTAPSLIAAEDFKQAGTFSLPEMTPYSENLLSITTHKADVTFVDPAVFQSFDKNNPGQLEINQSIPPVRLYAALFIVKKGEHDFVTMLSAALQHLLNNGKIEQIISKIEPIPNSIFMRVRTPYVQPGQVDHAE